MPRFSIDFLPNYSDEQILGELRRIAAAVGKTTVTKRDIHEHGRVSHSAVARGFGSLRVALQKAGLKSERFMKATDDELLDLLIGLWVRSLEADGRRPFKDDLSRFGYAISGDTITRRFGSWRAALLRAARRADVLGDEGEAPPSLTVREPRRISTHNGISIRKRFFVLKRDRYRCRLCGRDRRAARS